MAGLVQSSSIKHLCFNFRHFVKLPDTLQTFCYMARDCNNKMSVPFAGIR